MSGVSSSYYCFSGHLGGQTSQLDVLRKGGIERTELSLLPSLECDVMMCEYPVEGRNKVVRYIESGRSTGLALRVEIRELIYSLLLLASVGSCDVWIIIKPTQVDSKI